MRWDDLQDNATTEGRHRDLNGLLAPEAFRNREDAQGRYESPDVLQTDHDGIDSGLIGISEVPPVRLELEDTP